MKFSALFMLLVFFSQSLAFGATISKWNGISVGTSGGNVSAFNGKALGTAAGNVNAWNGLLAPAGAPIAYYRQDWDAAASGRDLQASPFDGWAVSGWEMIGYSNYFGQVLSAESHTPFNSARISADGGDAGADIHFSKTLTTAAGTASVWMSGDLPDLTVGGASVPFTVTGITAGIWAKYTFPVPAGNTEIAFHFELPPEESRYVYIDDIEIPIPDDHGSIVTGVPGTYTHTFTTNAVVTLTYVKGGGGGGADCDNSASLGNNGVGSTISYDGSTLASAGGGHGGDGNSCDYPSSASCSNTISGANNLTGGGAGGFDCAEYGADGSPGAAVTGGSFNVQAGKTLTVVVGGGGTGDCENGGDGSVSLSW